MIYKVLVPLLFLRRLLSRLSRRGLVSVDVLSTHILPLTSIVRKIGAHSYAGYPVFKGIGGLIDRCFFPVVEGREFQACLAEE